MPSARTATPSGRPLSSSTDRSALLYRLKAHIPAHLADTELYLASTAAALGISPRYVNDLLSDENASFQCYVLTERLAHCERDLSAPMLAHRHVSEIAFAWGFKRPIAFRPGVSRAVRDVAAGLATEQARPLTVRTNGHAARRGLIFTKDPYRINLR